MELLDAQPIVIERWNDTTKEKTGYFKSDIEHAIQISQSDPTNPNIFYVTVYTYSVIKEDNSDRIVMDVETYNSFRCSLWVNENFTIEFIFELMLRANREFAELFYDKNRGTNLRDFQIEVPTLDDYKAYITERIGTWYKAIRPASLN